MILNSDTHFSREHIAETMSICYATTRTVPEEAWLPNAEDQRPDFNLVFWLGWLIGWFHCGFSFLPLGV